MRVRHLPGIIGNFVAVALSVTLQACLAQAPAETFLFDAQPTHIWNRLHAALYERADAAGRTYGRDELDPLLWIPTKHLLTGPSREAAIRVLDEFLSNRAERLIRDPLRRAILQRDLWAIFDWSAQPSDTYPAERRSLELRLATIIQRLALSAEEIRALPDNYAAAVASHTFSGGYDPVQRDKPFLPPDLLARAGPWVCLGAKGGEPAALAHLYAVKGHSVFLVFLNLPGGRKQTLEYMRKLSDYPVHWRFNSERQGPDDPELEPNPDVPQFPPGTQLALVRRLMLVDDRGQLAVTPLTESIQFRVYRAIVEEPPPMFRPGQQPTDRPRADRSQDGFEFRLSRIRLLRNDPGGLRAVQPGEKEFPVLFSHEIDPFELRPEDGPMESHLRPLLRFCGDCHRRAGVLSVLSYANSFFGGPRFSRPATLIETSPAEEADRIAWWKRERYDWGLLQGLWQRSAERPSR